MRVDIYKFPYSQALYRERIKLFNIAKKGYIQLDKFDEDECWHLCNWSCYQNDKPSNLFSDLEYVNNDVFFRNEEDGKCYLALSQGWHVEDSLTDMYYYLVFERY